jgi:hypothetical protein
MADELQLEIHPTLQHISGYARGATLANGVTHVTLTVDLVYVEGALRQQPGHEYSIPGCITTAGGVISVRNLADSDLEVSAGQLLARGVPCSPENSTIEGRQTDTLSTREYQGPVRP